jgi:catechol 2,3-dioxygenase-like lactoylglutathione lyase family enzyme
MSPDSHPSTFRVLGTNHTSFTVSSLDRSIAFYRDCLGFELTSRAPRDPSRTERLMGVPGAHVEIAFVRAPGHTLELIEYRSPADRGKVQSRSCDTGAFHVAFNVSDLAAALAACRAHGSLPVGDTIEVDAGPNTGMRTCFVRDPDGILLELIQPARAG